jgi:hypothetical protein
MKAREDAVAVARAYAEAAPPALAKRWSRLADRIEMLRMRIADFQAEDEEDAEAIRAELEARIQRYLTCDRGEDLLASIGMGPRKGED